MIALEAGLAAGKNGACRGRMAKTRDMEELARELRALKAEGRRIVHCHGVFDLLHPGHIRHLAEAKRMGDVLVVTITPDRFVNKGPHRPAFTESLRAEVLGALDCVDFVGINRWPTAVEAIRLLQPDIYVKGQDYREASRDVTGGIVLEQEAVEAHGGRIEFTDDIVFSSSNLLNRYLPAFSAEVNDYLAAFRERHSAEEVKGWLDELASLNVLVLGEAILDEYVYCEPLNKSGKEPILAMQQLSREKYAGGSLAIANHLASFCRSVDLVTYAGDRDACEDFMREHLQPGVNPVFIRKKDSPTILKRRYVDAYSLAKLFEVYEINDEQLDASEERQVETALRERLDGCQLTLVCDFGHGLITEPLAGLVQEQSPFLAVNTQINAANLGFHTISKYARADYVCIQEKEIRLDSRSRKAELRTLVESTSRQMGCQLMITRGKQGTVQYDGAEYLVSPSLALEVVDRVGAGDAVFAITSLCAARGVPADIIGFIANAVGAQAVNIVGNSRSIDRPALFKTIDSLLK